MVWLGLAFVVSAIVAAVIAPHGQTQSFKDPASVLAFISLVAVAIERIIEGSFTMLAGPLGQWWPLKIVRDEFDTFETETNALLGPVVRRTLEELEAAKAAAAGTAAEVRRIQALIDTVDTQRARLQGQFTDVTSKLVPGSDRLARVSEINATIAATLQNVHQQSVAVTTGAQGALRTATEAADRASLIIASFRDNPARRVASLLLGMSLGMLVAAGVGLNLFVATLVGPTGSTESLPTLVAGALGVVLTGIVIGLGSAPTHEIVKSLQAYKDSRTAPVSVATLAVGVGAGSQVVQEGVVLEGFGPAPDGARPPAFRVRTVRQSG